MKYLVLAKYQDTDPEFLYTVTEDSDLKEKQETAKKYGMFTRAISEAEFFAECGSFEDRIEKMITLMPGVQSYTIFEQGKRLSLEIMGDWNHAHLFYDTVIFKTFEYQLIGEIETWDDGSDYYGSIHYYEAFQESKESEVSE